jgi:glycosyltransferase involved in cell wall biosynthesis
VSSNYLLMRSLLELGHDIRYLTPMDYPDVRMTGRGHFSQVRFGLRRRAHLVGRIVGPSSGMWSHLFDRVVRAPRQALALGRVAEREFRSWRPDVFLTLGSTARRLSRELRCVTIAWPQGPPGVEARAFLDFGRMHRTWMKRSRWTLLVAYHRFQWERRGGKIPEAAAIVTQSRWALERWKIAAPDVPAYFVPFSVDLDAFRPSGSESDRPSPWSFIHIGRMDPRKNAWLLLDAFELVRASHAEATLLVVGEPGYAPEVLGLFKGRANVVVLPPVPRTRVAELLTRHSLLVQSSNGESFGTAVMEASACGLTCVVGPDNGSAEFLDPCSRMAETYTAEAFAHAMLAAARAREQRWKDCQQAARSVAERAFAPGVAATRLVELVKSMTTRVDCD